MKNTCARRTRTAAATRSSVTQWEKETSTRPAAHWTRNTAARVTSSLLGSRTSWTTCPGRHSIAMWAKWRRRKESRRCAVVRFSSLSNNCPFSAPVISYDLHTAGLSGKPGIVMEPADLGALCTGHGSCRPGEFCGESMLKSPEKKLSPAVSHCYRSEHFDIPCYFMNF